MIEPILHRLIVKPDELETKDAAFAAARRLGIEVIREEREREQAAIDTGTVVAVGPTAFRDFGAEQSPVKVGDCVVYAKYGGKVIIDPETEEKFVALNDEDIVALLKKEPKNG